ncbi:DUF4926 domain-containing protein [Pseudonocardia lacus]|uniref:DUF4926 domain-containing protein n=1 Tax=Pseudonocardia lacus TaxID=2835865 RepID=UPI001BDC8DFF|nr:DUF4926 domain-containing protein [Pseudonocardia lacus]
MIRLLDTVRLTTDRYATDGARRGDIGCVVEIYDDGAFEIEFSDDDGVAPALFAAQPDEVEPAPQ